MEAIIQAAAETRGKAATHRKDAESCRPEVLRAWCAETALLAVRSLHAELTLYPKPGLVSPVDSGSHTDMDASLFMRSLFSLRHYFVYMAFAGANNASFTTLKKLGMLAEEKMLAATSGVNTHRGSIFSLGLLCAASGHCFASALPLSGTTIRKALLSQWGEALAEHASVKTQSTNGVRVAQHYSISGARDEARKGFPSIFAIALPQLRATLARGGSARHAQIDALFSLMAHIDDTNVYHRGGDAGAEWVKRAAQHFLAAGGTANPNWQELALGHHRLFVIKHLSPGGAADLLAASWFVHQSTQGREKKGDVCDD